MVESLTEPYKKDDPEFFKNNWFFSGKTGDCDFTIPEVEDVQHTCKRPKNLSFYRHQLLPSKYIHPSTPYRGLLLYHGLGSEKHLMAEQ